jgi:hypothetical protein
MMRASTRRDIQIRINKANRMSVESALADSVTGNTKWIETGESIVTEALKLYYSIYPNKLDNIVTNAAGRVVTCRMMDKYLSTSPIDFVGGVIRDIINSKKTSINSNTQLIDKNIITPAFPPVTIIECDNMAVAANEKQDIQNVEDNMAVAANEKQDIQNVEDITIIHFKPTQDITPHTDDNTFEQLNNIFKKSQPPHTDYNTDLDTVNRLLDRVRSAAEKQKEEINTLSIKKGLTISSERIVPDNVDVVISMVNVPDWNIGNNVKTIHVPIDDVMGINDERAVLFFQTLMHMITAGKSVHIFASNMYAKFVSSIAAGIGLYIDTVTVDADLKTQVDTIIAAIIV